MKRLAFLFAALVMFASAGSALADDPHRGNSGHFSHASCPPDKDSNPNCPPFGD